MQAPYMLHASVNIASWSDTRSFGSLALVLNCHDAGPACAQFPCAGRHMLTAEAGELLPDSLNLTL